MESKSRIDLNRYYSLQMNCLKYFGVWFHIPHSKTSIKFWANLFIKAAIGFFVFFLPTAGQILYVVKYTVYGDGEIQEIAGIVNLILAELQTSFKLLDLRTRRCRLARVMHKINSRSLSYFDARAHVVHKQGVRTARNIFIAILSSAGLDVVVHAIIVPALQRFQFLPVKMDLLFFDVYAEPYFNYICAYQILYKPTMITVCIALQSLPWAFMLYVSIFNDNMALYSRTIQNCVSESINKALSILASILPFLSELNILIDTIKNVENQMKVVKVEDGCNDDEAFKIIIRKCIDHYNAITSFIEEFQSAFSGLFTMSIVTTAGILGTTAVQILSIDSVIHRMADVTWIIMYMVNYTLILFIDCYYGNMITEKSLQVATVLYSSPWLSRANGLKREVVMLIARAQRPLTVYAATLVPMSIETFTTVMNWTYKGFAVLNHMKN